MKLKGKLDLLIFIVDQKPNSHGFLTYLSSIFYKIKLTAMGSSMLLITYKVASYRSTVQLYLKRLASGYQIKKIKIGSKITK